MSSRDLRSANALARAHARAQSHAWADALAHGCGTQLHQGSSPTQIRRGVIRTTDPVRINLGGFTSRGKPRAKSFQLTPSAPVRLDLPRHAYAGVPAWYSDIDLLIQVQIAYDLYYPTLRPALADCKGRGGVGKDTVLKVAAARAQAAEWETGRNSRLAVATIMERTGLGERTVQRATQFLRLIGAATEVFRGRQRTKRERMASWRKGDKGRGWASVYALHPPSNPQVRRAKLAADPIATPHPRRGPVRAPSSVSKNSLRATGKAGERKSRAPRDAATTGATGVGRSRRPIPNQKGLLLAQKWRKSPESPFWVSKCSPGRLAGVLAKPAAYGWSVADLDQLLRDHVSLGGWIAADPADPARLVGWLLKKHGDMEDRPAAADEAREQEFRAAATARRRAIAGCSRCGDDGFREVEGNRVMRCDHGRS